MGNYLVDQLYENVNVEKEVEGILPGEIKELAGPVSGGLRPVAGQRRRKGAEKLDRPGTLEGR